MSIHKMTFQSDYIWGFQQGVLIVIDQNLGNKSVTNDVENVINNITKQVSSLHEVPVIYIDSAGSWDQILVNEHDKFAGFNTIGTTDLSDAIRIVKDNMIEKAENTGIEKLQGE